MVATGAAVRARPVTTTAPAGASVVTASFAGQQETFLNIEGLANIKHAVHEVFASLFNDRAISYRVHRGYAHENVALSAGTQQRSLQLNLVGVVDVVKVDAVIVADIQMIATESQIGVHRAGVERCGLVGLPRFGSLLLLTGLLRRRRCDVVARRESSGLG